MNEFNELTLIERPAIDLFASMGYETINCFHESLGSSGTLGRETTAEVVLIRYLRKVMHKLNPTLSNEAIELAIDEIARDRSSLSLVNANREVDKLLKDGVKVTYKNDEGEEEEDTAKVIDWNNPENNHFLLTSQLWITGEIYKRRADLIGFINGLPLIFIELKSSKVRLEDAFNDNLTDYKQSIPQLFWYNGIVILSNGSESKIGSMSSAWEHFNDWKKINSEGEKGIVSLDTLIKGTCEPHRLLDLLENFTLFKDDTGTPVKILSKNHQYLGVNNALQAVKDIETNKGRLGVFWHTQGAGKSFSMVFFVQKILRKIPGNWTFVVVTDRTDLDEQIYQTFASVGAITEKRIQAESCNHLQQLLTEDHRIVFTLIHKFQSNDDDYPMLSDRSDIIVITDEAHRSQYDTLAMNMRTALPNASFIGFTGTPLMAGEEKTREVFGDYVSIYNFTQSIEDKATVPLFYENRIPELQIINESFNDDIHRIVDDAGLDDEQEKRLEREFSKEYQLITRDDRLDTIAEDIVTHFMNRGQLGKAMVVAIDKLTAVKMYNKVQTYWQKHLDKLRQEFKLAPNKVYIASKIKYMEETDMAVVISSGQNEENYFKSKGLDILPHRKRMINEDLANKFKDPKDKFRIVFVCAMWLTGFDAPSVNTIYLDKPMRNHTLMQTIARANRVFGNKTCGTIVDYIGVFRDLQKALAIYALPSAGEKIDTPVRPKKAIEETLKQVLQETDTFCKKHKVELDQILTLEGLELIKAIDDAVDALIVNEETTKRFKALTDTVADLYKALKPDPAAKAYKKVYDLLVYIKGKINSLTPTANIDAIMQDIEDLLDVSIASEGYIIKEPSAKHNPIADLSQIDFESLKKMFGSTKRKNTEVERLKGLVDVKLKKMVKYNKSRIDYLEKFQKLIDEYNSGALNVELMFDKLVELSQELNEEDKRTIFENLTEEELAMFDLLTKTGPELTDKEKNQVKKVVRELLETLKREKLVLDWKKRQQTRAAVRISIEKILDAELPRAYTNQMYQEKCDSVYEHVYDNYHGQGSSIYAS